MLRNSLESGGGVWRIGGEGSLSLPNHAHSEDMLEETWDKSISERGHHISKFMGRKCLELWTLEEVCSSFFFFGRV